MKTIIIKDEFKDDYITRAAGEKLRNIIVKEISSNSEITVDFTDVIIASTSFLDEAFAKLIDHKLTKDKIDKLLIMKNINPRDKELLKRLSKKRFSKKNSPKW